MRGRVASIEGGDQRWHDMAMAAWSTTQAALDYGKTRSLYREPMGMLAARTSPSICMPSLASYNYKSLRR